MATNLRIGQLHAYQPYPEVEPVSPYPRVDPQQRDENPQRQPAARQRSDDQARRRFVAMRKLIEEMKKSARQILRVDYFTAEAELHDLGLGVVEGELPPLLNTLRMSQADMDFCFKHLRDSKDDAVLRTGEELTREKNPLPVFVPGLIEYSLCFPAFVFNSEILLKKMQEEQKAQFVLRKGSLTMVFFTSESRVDQLWCHVYAQAAVCELDEAGRRVVFYPRVAADSYALYADKQINIAI